MTLCNKTCVMKFVIMVKSFIGLFAAKPCLAALQRATSNRKAGIADILKPICDVNGFYKLGYYCGAFRCFCVVDKYGRKDFKIFRENCNKQQKTIGK